MHRSCWECGVSGLETRMDCTIVNQGDRYGKKGFKEIDILRGMAIVLVLLGHAIIVYPVNLHKILWCNVLFTWLSTVHMSLFFSDFRILLFF